ncbi:hypothetical protein [Alteromonas sp. OM2203]|uniref:hypothetical protein n=1 Tax=Alteromonas sp. OM2203 TaxID=3398817 RepID=UPI003AF3B8E3
MKKRKSDALILAAMQYATEFCISCGINVTGYAIEKAVISESKRNKHGVTHKNGKFDNHLKGRAKMNTKTVAQLSKAARQKGVRLIASDSTELIRVLEGIEKGISYRQQHTYLSDVGDHAAKKLSIDLQFNSSDCLNDIIHFAHVIPSDELLAVLLVSLQSLPNYQDNDVTDKEDLVFGAVSFAILMTSVDLIRSHLHQFLVNYVFYNDALLPVPLYGNVKRQIDSTMLEQHYFILSKLFETMEWLLNGEPLAAQREFCCRLAHADFDEILVDIEYQMGVPDSEPKESVRGLCFVFLPLSKPFALKHLPRR